MTIKGRMIAGAAFTTAAILAIVGISLFAVLQIKSNISLLTGRSTPLQVKTLELQQTVEKISADFLRLGGAADGDEVKRYSGEISSHMAEMEAINTEVRTLGDSTRGIDTAVFREVQEDVVRVLDQRLKDIALFRSDASSANAALKKVEDSILAIRNRISALNSEAVTAVGGAHRSNLVINSTVKKLLSLQTKLKDLEVAISDTETIRNRFRLSPVRERVKAITDSVRSVSHEKGEPAIIDDIKGATSDIYEQFARNNGLIALRSDVLSGRDADGEYQALKKEMLKAVDALNSRLSESIDPLEMQIVKERQKVDVAFGFQNTAGEITALGNLINIDVKELNGGIRLIMLSGSDEELNRITAHTGMITGRITGNMERLKNLLGRSGQSELLKDTDNISAAIRTAIASTGRIIAAKKSVLASDASMLKAINTVKTVSDEQSRRGDEQVKSIRDIQQKMVSDVNTVVKGLLTLISAISLIVIVTVIAVSGKTTASVTKPIKDTKNLIADISKGDLTKKVHVQSNDEIGDMCRDMSGFINNLHDTISRVAERTDMVASSAGELSATSEQLSRKASLQADDAHSLSVSAEEMSATVLDVAKNAQSASDFSNDVREKALRGGDVVLQAIDGIQEVAGSVKEVAATMSALSNSSVKIGEIVTVIKEIADQTNLLSLNAAIEAARAGDQGRGFAVVADEVRKLAEKTAGATAEISEMIGAIQADTESASASMDKGLDDVERGVALANKAGDALKEIVQGVEKIAEMAGNIAAASNEQSTTVDMMASNITRVADSSREFTAGTTQTAKAAENLDIAATELRELIKQFTI